MLELHQIEKSYNRNTIIAPTSMVLPPGKYWLKGNNGAGKSTLLKILSGLIPCRGDVSIQASTFLKKNPVAYRKQVSYAPAEPVYPAFVSGQSLVAFYQNIKKAAAAEITGIKEMLLMHEYLQQPVGTYSSGMLKKLSLLLALMGNPGWLFLDEPLTTLDTATQQQLIQWLQHSGSNIILTSHHDILPDQAAITHIIEIHNQQLHVSKAS